MTARWRTRRRIAAAFAAVLAIAGGDARASAPERPHVVVILADDLGWNDVSYHGSEIPTPHIDRIAREGVELDRFYVQPSCSPTRAALMTGKSPLRLGITRPISKNERRGVPRSETLLPERLAGLGYETRLVGKWHLGHSLPDLFPISRGFESSYGNLTGGIGFFDHNHGGGHDWQRDGRTLREEGYATRLSADEAVRVIETRDPDRPLFLYLAFNAPHLPNEAPEETVARFASIEDPERRVHAAMVGELDHAIGRVLAALEREAMAENTIVFFSSDNGGLVADAAPEPFQTLADVLARVFDRPIPTTALEFLVEQVKDGGSDNTPLRGGKATIHEGGVRVPAALWWPGRLEGATSERFLTICDVLPTLLDAIGEADAIPGDLDGRSQWASLTGAGESETPDYAIAILGEMAVYRPPWKLVGPSQARLYDVYADPEETEDLSVEYPGIVDALVGRANEWPRGPELDRSMLDIALDPDTFGGPEDRPPWADVAWERWERGERASE